MYNVDHLDSLAYNADDRRAFEYWLHAACIIPISEYRYRLPIMREYRESRAGWRGKWISQPGNAELAEQTLKHIEANGAARTSDFESERSGPGAWWNWKPAKIALEHLYNCGDAMVSDRVNFQRVYDLRERVLPDGLDTTEPSVDETNLHILESSMRRLGVCEPAQVSDYTHMKRTVSKPYIAKLMADGTFVSIQAELMDGESHDLIVHCDDVSLLDQAADGEIVSQRTTFLSPFDNLFWAKDRDERFWGFNQILEAYKPEPIRVWGYFCLPILHKDRLIGRFDPKLERATGTLRIVALHLEPNVDLDDEMIADVALTMRDFMVFHDATELVIEKSKPPAFGKKLRAAM